MATHSERPQFAGAALFNSKPPFLTGVTVDRADRVYYQGDLLRAQFMAEREARLYVLYHQSDGSTLLLFPNVVQPKNVVTAHTPLVLPADDGKSFRFRVSPPFGDEVFQVLASTRPIAELDGLVKKTGKAPRISPELLATLAGRLAKEPTTWTEHRLPIKTAPRENVPPTPPAARIGLFIGIGKYLHPEIAATHEELENSAKVMYDLMLKQGGLDPRRTQLVLNEQATKENLQQLICHWLPGNSRPGDTVFIYFSGHAGVLPNGDSTEPDGMDEVLGPYDLEGAREGDIRAAALARFRNTSIVDDTFGRWLEELAGRQVVLIVDTCHSGGLVSGKGAAKAFLADETARVKDIAQTNILVLASCASDEQTLFEGTRNKTMWFTYCLTEAIENSEHKHPLTVQDAFTQASARLKQLLREGNAAREQQPQMTDNILLPVVLAQ